METASKVPSRQILLVLLILVIPFAIMADYIFKNYLIFPNFKHLEREESLKDIKTCVDALNREAHHLCQLSSDWSTWDDMYTFAQDGNQAFIDSNFQMASLSDVSEIHLAYVYDKNGDAIWGKTYDPIQGMLLPLPDFPDKIITKDHLLLSHKTLDTKHTGIILTARGPMFIASTVIQTSLKEGPKAGTYIVGRFLLESTLEALQKQTNIKFEIKNPLTSELSEEEQRYLSQIPAEGAIVVEANSEELILYEVLMGLDQKPAILISARLPRMIMRQGRQMAQIISLALYTISIISWVLLFAWFTSFQVEARRRKDLLDVIVGKHAEEIAEREKQLRLDNMILTAQCDCAPYGILAVNENGKFFYYNQKFLELWSIPVRVAESRNEGKCLTHVLGRLSNPSYFLKRIEYLNDHAEEDGYDKIRLDDGRILERHSSPLVDQNQQNHGRVWYFDEIRTS